ncbi:unnamed protein product [Sphagnum tenellum]
MFRATLDEVIHILTEEYPVDVPGQPEDLNLLIDVLNAGHFGEQGAMGVTWYRQRVALTDADTLLLPFSRHGRADDQFPFQLMLLRLRIDDAGKAVLGIVPERVSRPANAVGRHRIKKRLLFRASNQLAASKLAIIAPGIGPAWIDQFEKRTNR